MALPGEPEMFATSFIGGAEPGFCNKSVAGGVGVSPTKLKRYSPSYIHTMKLITLFALFVGALSYRVETVKTFCFLVNTKCHQDHAKDVEIALNKNINYLSHSTTSTKSGMHTMIVYK